MFSARLTWKYPFLLPLFLFALNLSGGKAEAITAPDYSMCLNMEDVEFFLEFGLSGNLPEENYQELDRILSYARDNKYYTLPGGYLGSTFCSKIVKMANNEKKSAEFRARWVEKIENSRPVTHASLQTDSKAFVEYANILSRYLGADVELSVTLTTRVVKNRELLPRPYSLSETDYLFKSQTIDNNKYIYFTECRFHRRGMTEDPNGGESQDIAGPAGKIGKLLCAYISKNAQMSLALDKQGIARSDTISLDITSQAEPKMGPLENISDMNLKEGVQIQMGQYPSRAQREGREGVAKVRLMLGPDPLDKTAYIPFDCEIAESSGHPDLDAASCGYWINQLAFEPLAGLSPASPYILTETSIGWRIPSRFRP